MKKSIIMGLGLISIIPTLISCNNSTVKITFNPNGGTVDVDSKTVSMGDKVSLPKPTKEGRHFLGWYTGFDDDSKLITESTEITDNYNLYARWDYYNVSYYDNKDNKIFDFDVPDSGYVYDYGITWDKELNILCHQDMDVKAVIDSNSSILKTTIASYGLKSKNYTIPFEYNKEYFTKDNEAFMAKYSLLASIETESQEELEKLLTDSDFTNIKTIGYKTKEKTGYTLATLDIGNKKLVMIIIKSFRYTHEWSYNFKVGNDNDHQGFIECRDFVLEGLEDYLSTYDLNHTELLITGYSKGGAIAGLIGKELLENNTLGISNDKFLVYTFEAPTSSLTNGESNIYNYVNEADLIVNLYPYNMLRPGTDISIYSDKINKLMNQFDSSIKFKSFTTNSKYQADKDYPKYIIDSLLAYTKKETESPNEIKTRQEFNTNYATSMSYVIDKVFSLDFDTIIALYNSIKENITIIIANKDLIISMIENYLQSANISYEFNELQTHINNVIDFINGPASILKTEFIFNNSNLSRMIQMHFPIVTYVLLLNHFK